VARAAVEVSPNPWWTGSPLPSSSPSSRPGGCHALQAINTMDSTFGYKNDRYRNFAGERPGWTTWQTSSRPITGLLVPWPPSSSARLAQLLADLPPRPAEPRQPNSAHTEAGVRGAGDPAGRHQHLLRPPVTKPFIGEPLTPVSPCHILAANRLLFATTLLAAALGLLAWPPGLNSGRPPARTLLHPPPCLTQK